MTQRLPDFEEERRTYTGSGDGYEGCEDLTPQASRTELANSKRFIDRHGDRLRYVPLWGKWLVNVGTHWQIDDGCLVETMARDVVEQVWAGVEQGMRAVELECWVESSREFC